MFLIATVLGPSRIHGLGVMAAEAVRAGEPIWRFAPGVDHVLPCADLEGYPAAFRAYLEHYAYPSPEFPDALVLSCDHAKFMNHSDDPNTESRGRVTLAARDIASGEEITCDYRAFVVGWTGFETPSGAA